MIVKELGNPAGFQVAFESDGWRMAYHAYKAEVNSLQALKNWGIHVDSDEVFVLLKGEAYLATAGALEKEAPVCMTRILPEQLHIVEKGERHAIILKEGAAVVIMENLDMSRFVEQPVAEEDLELIRRGL